MPAILIIEDETELSRVLRSYLEKAGMQVTIASRGDAGMQLWERNKPDLVLLDLNLPGLDGLDIVRQMRQRLDTPIIVITARVEEADRLIGLELGADDYIPKPFSPREVVARVRAVLRRSGAAAPVRRAVTVGKLVIDPESHSADYDGEPLELTPTEFSLLATLAAQPGRVFARLQLLEAAQGTSFAGYERTVDAHVKNLRAKLSAAQSDPGCIETVFGVGYRFKK